MFNNSPQVWRSAQRSLCAALLTVMGWSAAANSQENLSQLQQEASASSAQKAPSTLYFSGKAHGSSSGLYALDSRGTVTQLISGNPSQFRHVDISTVSEKAAFVADRNHRGEPGAAESRGGINVYTVDLSGENISAMTDNQHRELYPRFSPNGELIAYVRMEGGQHHLVMEAFRSRSGRTLLSSDEILDVAWAPGGQQLVVAKRIGVQSRVSVVDLHRLDPLETKVLWSDGENIAEGNGSVLPEHNAIAVSWSPDGKKIAYITRSAEDEAYQSLYVMHLEDSRSQRISQAGTSVQAPVQWSRTSNYVLYAAISEAEPEGQQAAAISAEGEADVSQLQADKLEGQKSAVKHIYVANLEGNLERLTSRRAWHSRPVFSPDESQVAFLYAESAGAADLTLMTMTADGSDYQALYDQVTINSFLQWHAGIFTPASAEPGENGVVVPAQQ